MEPPTDEERLDWIEAEALKPTGILIHDGRLITGRVGIAISPGNLKRTLREALDYAMGWRVFVAQPETPPETLAQRASAIVEADRALVSRETGSKE